MQYSPIGPAPRYSWLPKPVLKEIDRINKLVETLQESRVTAESFSDTETDKSVDRSPLLKARISAIQQEISYRESVCILNAAIEQTSRQLRDQAKAELLEIEQRRREELGIPDNIKTPEAVLQTSKAWWTARAKLNAIPMLNNNRESAENENAIRNAQHTLQQLANALANEPARLKKLLEQREREAAAQHELETQQAERHVVRDTRQVRVDALLSR